MAYNRKKIRICLVEMGIDIIQCTMHQICLVYQLVVAGLFDTVLEVDGPWTGLYLWFSKFSILYLAYY